VTELERGTGQRGVVTGFDEVVGLGVISDAGGDPYPFHCIEIADGSRSVEIGAEVRFDLLAKLGRWEAANIRR
jgi:CspA family cold shock protein